MAVTTSKIKTEKTSKIVNLETYTPDTRLVISRPPTEKAVIGGVYRMSPLAGGGGEFSTVVQNVFKSLPEDSVIQVCLVVSPDHEAAETFAKGKVHGGHVVQDLIERQKKLFASATKTDALQDMPMLNVSEVIIALAVPTNRVEGAALEESENLQNDFLAELRNCGFYDVERLSAAQLAGVYRKFANIYAKLQKEVQLDPFLDLKQQIYGPDEDFDFSRDRRIGAFGEDTYCAVITCKSYPEHPFHGIMNLVSGAPFNKGQTKEGGGQRNNTPFILSTTVRVGNQRKEWRRVESAIKSRTTVQNVPLKLGVEDSNAKLNDLLALKKMVSGDGNRYVHVSTTAFVFGRTPKEARVAATTLKGTLDRLEFDARLVVGNMLVRFAQMLPLNFSVKIAEALQGETTTAASEVGCLLPVYGDYLGNVNANSPITGAAFITRRGRAHYFDPFTSNSNFCGTMCAKSGAGKSFSLQYQIECDLAMGRMVILFDNGRSSKNFCRAVGGEFNEFGEGDFRPSLNPFTGLTDDEFAEQQEGITDLVVMMAYGDEKVDPGARIAVNEAVKAAWAQKNDEAEISTVIDCLRKIVESAAQDTFQNQVVIAASNVVPRLRSFIESPTRGVYFRGPSTLDASKQLTVFELASLGSDEHLKRCVLFCAMNVLMTRLRKTSAKKRFWVDEAIDLFKVESAGAAMEGLYLKGRKEKLAVWIIVQSLLALSRYAAGEVILRQSAWKMIMAQEPEEIDQVIDKKVMTAFSGDAYFAKLLRGVESKKFAWSETLIMGEQTYEVVRLYVDKFTATLFSSEDDRDEVFRLVDVGMSVIEATIRVMGDKKARLRESMLNVIRMYREHDGLTDREILAEMEELCE
ncbi:MULTISPECIES: TraC family protein [Paraburkholderia]|uniref:TraC family protein n=1 Tax=Paraburkholderia madseniana TaxID=2599607 RepID=A0AAP5BJM2_9BURK|nr:MULTISPECIES: TraC family protein [Paraburkholderia]MCX4151032.1 TraC family protein [Paraburkholderia madseniana]MCX4176672.1 TraC family protein [Paraburkholderia madseniana]MDN7153964.1 TraC family protein [Paraburkholderia sp. WS6]MDQ6412846.1 TraC family protein [Paraburkholderia madseniana]MDQ6464663.1 TraC family protein [Paraburkholderia madseniana]